MSSKSQQDLEQPAKVYQLDAVETKVDQLLAEVKSISQSVNGVITNSQLEARLQQFKEDINNDVDLKYGPIKNGAWFVVGAVIVGVIAQVVLNLLNLGGK